MGISIRDYYNQNQQQIQRLRDYLKSHDCDAKVRKNAWMITERDVHDEEELIIEIARLCKENKYIRNQAIVNPSFLEYEHHSYTHDISAEFDKAGRNEVHAS